MFIVSSRCRRPPCKTPTESSGPCAGCGSIAGGSRPSASPSRASCWPTTSFRYDRDLLKDLCRVAHERLIEFLRTSLGLPEGVPVSSWPLTPSASIWISTPPAARAGGRRAVCAFGGLPRHAQDRSQALGGTVPRQVRLRGHGLPNSRKEALSLFFPRKCFFTLSVINVRPPHLAGPPPTRGVPAPIQDLGHSRSRIVIEPASVPEAASKPALRHAGLYGAGLVAWIPFLGKAPRACQGLRQDCFPPFGWRRQDQKGQGSALPLKRRRPARNSGLSRRIDELAQRG
jgi:hypothetical protein